MASRAFGFSAPGCSSRLHALVAARGASPTFAPLPRRCPLDELLALDGCCDAFLSLHHSEGFGRGIAEALQLGVDVIATAYGGNTDFCIGPLAHPVRCKEVPIPSGAYPWTDRHR